MRREHVVVSDHTVIIEHGVEHGTRRASSTEMINGYMRTGRYTIHVDNDKDVQHVFYRDRLVCTIRKTSSGTFVAGRYASRDRNVLIEMILKPIIK
jgi:hypothetical protein